MELFLAAAEGITPLCVARHESMRVWPKASLDAGADKKLMSTGITHLYVASHGGHVVMAKACRAVFHSGWRHTLLRCGRGEHGDAAKM